MRSRYFLVVLNWVDGNEIFTISPINFQISGGREAAVARGADVVASVLTSTSFCALVALAFRGGLSPLADCRCRFAGGLGGLGRGWRAFPAVLLLAAEIAGPPGVFKVETLSFSSLASIAVTFRFGMLLSDVDVDVGEIVEKTRA